LEGHLRRLPGDVWRQKTLRALDAVGRNVIKALREHGTTASAAGQDLLSLVIASQRVARMRAR
jgi:hypothetical protein